MHVSPRNASIDKLVLHVNVGPEVDGGARGLQRYLNSIDAGYHQIADNRELVVCTGDNTIVWGAAGMNTHGLHLCMIGGADQSAADWNDPYSSAEREIAAHAIADWCRIHQIPAQRLTVPQVGQEGVRGICRHKDVTDAYGGNNAGHYDPGPNFPIDGFCQRVRDILAGNNPAPPVVWKVQPMYNPPLQVAAVLKNPAGNVVGGVSLDGHVYAWGIPFNHDDPSKSQPFGNAYFAGRLAAQLVWPNDKEKKAGMAYTVISTSAERYSYPAK